MKRIFLKLIILFLISNIPVALFNYVFDPYGIFNNKSLRLGYEPGYEPNQRYAKMRHLINDRHSWDSFLFGSSRVGKINPGLIPGGNYYNMNYSEGLPGEHLADIQLLLKRGIPVKNVMIAVDNFSITARPEDHDGQILRNPYDISPFKRAIFQVKYLCSAPRFSIMKYIGRSRNESLMNFNITGNGQQTLEKVDRDIENNIENHMKSKRFSTANIHFKKGSDDSYIQLIESTVRDIAEIEELSKRYNFNLYVFVNPVHELYYLDGRPDLFFIFKERLASVVDYWDFSGLNSITTDNYYFYETSHYRTLAGDLIICRLYNCDNIKVPEDFGFFVTKKNVCQYTKKQKDMLIAYNKEISVQR